MQLEIEIKAEDGRYVVIPRGEVDLVTQAQVYIATVRRILS